MAFILTGNLFIKENTTYLAKYTVRLKSIEKFYGEILFVYQLPLIIDLKLFLRGNILL